MKRFGFGVGRGASLVFVLGIFCFFTSVFSTDSLSSFAGNFTEGFESGSFSTNSWSVSGGATSNWTVSTVSPHSGTYLASAENTDSESILSTNISTIDYGNISFSFWYSTAGLDSGEYLRADWYNGTGWVNVLDFTAVNVGYTFANYSLGSAANNNSDFKIRFRCNVNSNNEICSVDDVRITGNKIVNISERDIYIIGEDLQEIRIFNNTAAENSNYLIINLSVSSVYSLDSWYLNFTANGSNACALGNKQSSYCYVYPEFVQFINGTETASFDGTKISQSDYILPVISSSGSVTNFSFQIDEHYNPNVFKWYGALFNFSDDKYQNASGQRITGDNAIKFEINSSIVPTDMDLARFDLRIGYVGAPAKLEAFACNSSYSNENFHTYAGCALIAEKQYGELEEGGTKFKGVFTKALIDGIGDFRYVIIHSEETNSSEYYYIKTYGVTASEYTTHWEYTNNLGSSWANLGDGYETQMNVNWFYADVDNPTEFVYRFWANDSLGNEEYREGNLSWSVSAIKNYQPLVVFSSQDLSYISVPKNVSFSAVDTNGDSLNVSLFLYKSGVLNQTIITDLDENDSYYYINSAVVDDSYDLVLKACELGTSDLFCRNSTASVVFDSTNPAASSAYPAAGDVLNSVNDTEIAINVSEANIDFVYANVTYPNSTVLRVNLSNDSVAKFNGSFYPDVTGVYNISFYVEDLADNVNDSVTSWFNVTDSVSPSVGVIYPLGKNFSLFDDVALSLNIYDFSSLGSIYANMTYPNGSIVKFEDFNSSIESDSFSVDSFGTSWENITSSLASGQECFMDINETVAGAMYLGINGSASNGSTFCGLQGVKKAEGNFDMEIEFNVTGMEEDSIFVFRSSNLETLLPEGERAFLYISKSGSNFLYTFGSSNDTFETTVSVNDSFGNFRIVRLNSSGSPYFNLYYWNETNSSWTNPLGNVTLPDSLWTQFVQLYVISTGSNYGNINVSVESFEIQAGLNYICETGTKSSVGRYNVTFFVNDSFGNENATEITYFDVSWINQRPSRPFITNPGNGDYISGVINISWLDIDELDNDTVQFNISLLNLDETVNDSLVSNYGDVNSSEYEFNSSNYLDGSYKFRVSVFENDTSDNYSSTDTMTEGFTIDNTYPLIEFGSGTTSSGSYSSGTVSFNVSFSDDNLKNVTVRLYSDSVDYSSSSASSPYSGSFSSVAAGSYYLVATVYDEAENENSTEVRTIVISGGDGSGGGGGNTFSTSSESLAEGVTKIFVKDSKYYFDLDGASHVFEIFNSGEDFAFVRIFSRMFEKRMSVGEVWKVDFEEDLVYDLSVKLNSIEGRLLNMTIREINESYVVEESEVEEKRILTTGQVVAEVVSAGSFWWSVLVLGLVGAVLFVLWKWFCRRERLRECLH